MDSCTTLTVALHLRLQFPSSIALTTHTADCTDYTPYINHGPLPLGRVLFSVYPSDSYSTEPSKSCLACSPVFWYLPVFPGLTLCPALLDIVRRSSTHACPRITLCLARVVPVCHWMNLACFVTTPLNKACKWIRTSHVLFAHVLCYSWLQGVYC